MQKRAVSGFAFALIIVGCGAADEGGSGDRNSTVGGAVTGGTGGAASGVGTGGTHAVPGGTGGTGNAPVGGMIGGTGGAIGGGGMLPGAGGNPGLGIGMIGGAGMGSPMPVGAGGMTGGGTAGTGGIPVMGGSKDPIIPEVSGECPDFSTGIISFMGLGGIEIESGAPPAQPSAPMVFYWHGTGGTSGEYALQAAEVSAGVLAEGGVLVSFNDTTGGDLNSGTFIFGATDFDLTDQLVACAVRDRNIDPRRIYATGCSAGGLFADAMGALRSNYMAAVASNSGGFPVLSPAFQNDHTPALMTIHGAAGVDVVAIDFSEASALADDGYKMRGGFVINCDHGGGHCGGGFLAGDIWNFFEAHPFGVDPEPWSAGLPAGFNSVCVIK